MSFDSNKRARAARRLSAGRHIAMGVLLLALAYAVLTYRYFGTLALSPAGAYGLAAIMAVYALFRLFRGIQDARYRNDDAIE